MEKIFEEENHVYQIDFTKAHWATDRLNTIFTNGKTELSDVDFIAETEEDILFIEYKNASIPNAINPNAFKPEDNKKISQVVKKYYDSFAYINAIGKSMDKKKVYIYILEYPLGDPVTRKGIRDRLQRKLPFLLQQQNFFVYNMIDSVKVLSINEWNGEYANFPLEKIGF